MTSGGQWRATYTPGRWLVLCGPTSLVVIEPPGAGWTPLVEELWQQVLASSSLPDLAQRLAAYGLDTMPSFGALFWTPAGMRSLVRGGVTVVDPADGRAVASGEGIQTWSEVGLGALATVEVRTADATEPAADGLQLPLAVGAVQASAVTLDARDQARVRSPQAATPSEKSSAAGGAVSLETATARTSPPARPSEPEAETDDDVEPTQLLPDPSAGPDQPLPPDAAQQALENADTELVQLGSLPPVPAPAARPAGPTVDAVLCPYGHANPPAVIACRICGTTVTDQRAQRVAQPVVAVLRGSDGSEALLDRTVLVGRAPAERGPDPVRLLTVPSPGHDISRTHLQVGIDGWHVVVTDLHSTNGTLLVEPGTSVRRSLPPGQPVPVALGSVLELADGVSVTVSDPR